MYPAPFDYHRAGSVAEATTLLNDHGGDTALLAGGTSLIPRMKARHTRPRHVIDIGGLSELTGITRQDGVLMVGALTPHADLARSGLIADAAPLLGEAAAQIGDPQVRNAGTVGGSVAEVYPGADLPACLLALRARLHVSASGGSSDMGVDEQFGSGEGTVTGGRQLVTHVEIPISPSRSGGTHIRLERKAGIAVIGCSAQVSLDEDGRYAGAWAAFNGLRSSPVTAIGGDGGLVGRSPAPGTHRDAADRAVTSLESFTDARGSSTYRLKTAAAVLARALDIAARRGGS